MSVVGGKSERCPLSDVIPLEELFIEIVYNKMCDFPFFLHLKDESFVQSVCRATMVENQPFLHPSLRRQSLSCTKLLSPHSSGEGEEDKPEARLAMVNREIVRRGALILFCDYVVRL